MREAGGFRQEFFRLESFRVITERRGHGLDAGTTTEATVKVHVGDERVVATAEGNGPVHALDAALRQAIAPHFEALHHLRLSDYRVRVLDTSKGTGAVTRVLLDTTDGDRTWSTIGVSDNLIEASWQALVDSIVYGLLHHSLAAATR
jgi:2-isopropylmalate synthase